MILRNFIFSYSAYSTYKESELQFYFQFLKKVIPSDKGITGYGNAGNVVHNALEKYLITKEDRFNFYWNKFKSGELLGFRDKPLKKEVYRKYFDKGINYINDNLGNKAIPELRIEKNILDLNIKAFIDVFENRFNKNIIIYDWKTNSKDSYNLHLDQRLFYSWLIWKLTKVTPKCKWYYLKTGKEQKDKFTEKELIDFEQTIIKLKKSLIEKGDNIKNYSAGNYKNPFNQYFTLCENEIIKRQQGHNLDIKFYIQGNYVFLNKDVSAKLEEGIDYATKFDLPDKYFIQQTVKNKSIGIIDIRDVGTVHLYNYNFKCFPLGLIKKVKQICKDYAEHYNKKLNITIIDNRDKKVTEYICPVFPESLNTDKILRPYQQDSIDAFFKNEGSGIINIATGGGKTFVAGNIIHKLKTRTLWIIDRKELLEQTKTDLEDLFGFLLGYIYDGKIDIKDVTIATVQSLNSKIKDLEDYLKTVNFVVLDEYHKSAAESYKKIFTKLVNTKYRLGITATPTRDDGKTPILYSLLGDVIYKCKTQDLIKLGFLVKPTINFIKLKGYDIFSKNYHEDYNFNIVNNDQRNLKIINFCKENIDKKILILTKQVLHGKYLNEKIVGSKHIHGTSKKRKSVMDDFRHNKFRILIGTLSIFSEGIDLPNLDVIINASANKGDVKSIQVLGRVLRTFGNKNTALYLDFLDTGKYTSSHSQDRIMAFKEQGHNMNYVE